MCPLDDLLQNKIICTYGTFSAYLRFSFSDFCQPQNQFQQSPYIILPSALQKHSTTITYHLKLVRVQTWNVSQLLTSSIELNFPA